MKVKVGLIAQNLRQAKPRGVARVARAFVEQLLRHEDLDCYVIKGPSFSLNDIMVEHYALDDYLAQVPLDLTAYAPVRSWPFGWFGRGGGAIDPGVCEARCRGLGKINLEWFDAVVSFEAFEDIWDWPVDGLSTRFFGILHDTIPFRVYEGPNGNPEHFFRAVGKFIARADHVICNSAATERDAHAFFPSCRDRTSVIHLGHFPPPDQPAVGKARDPDTVTLTMLGDMDRRKNLQTALRALQFVAEGVPGRRVVLEVIGNSGQRQHFATLEAEARRFAEVRWLGYLPDDERYRRLAASDVFLFPSLWEGFGIPVLEAMACGVEVVTSGLSSLPEVGGSHASYIADPYEPREIARVVLEVLARTAEERASRVARGKTWASTFSWERAGARMAELLRNSARSPRAGGVPASPVAAPTPAPATGLIDEPANLQARTLTP